MSGTTRKLAPLSVIVLALAADGTVKYLTGSNVKDQIDEIIENESNLERTIKIVRPRVNSSASRLLSTAQLKVGSAKAMTRQVRNQARQLLALTQRT